VCWCCAAAATAVAASVAEFGRAFTTGEPHACMARFLERKR
jgi:hypothetical protein